MLSSDDEVDDDDEWVESACECRDARDGIAAEAAAAASCSRECRRSTRRRRELVGLLRRGSRIVLWVGEGGMGGARRGDVHWSQGRRACSGRTGKGPQARHGNHVMFLFSSPFGSLIGLGRPQLSVSPVRRR
ncbi:hypothetical protein VTK73DRAFT_5658 [Phialemonium thermophilum]|uniref:Uncharacterized protein n=1 Tax=Phialemonium thermophilum TaxID=223376 RepID=A0ABR3V0V6_9PEZI